MGWIMHDSHGGRMFEANYDVKNKINPDSLKPHAASPSGYKSEFHSEAALAADYHDSPEYRKSLHLQGEEKEALLESLRKRLGMRGRAGAVGRNIKTYVGTPVEAPEDDSDDSLSMATSSGSSYAASSYDSSSSSGSSYSSSKSYESKNEATYEKKAATYERNQKPMGKKPRRHMSQKLKHLISKKLRPLMKRKLKHHMKKLRNPMKRKLKPHMRKKQKLPMKRRQRLLMKNLKLHMNLPLQRKHLTMKPLNMRKMSQKNLISRNKMY